MTRAGVRQVVVMLCSAALAGSAPRALQGQQGQATDPRELEAKRECLAGRYQRGVELLAALFVETSEPIYLYNQGRCYEQNARLDQAVTSFREYVRNLRRAGENAAEVAEVEARIKTLEEEISRRRTLALAEAASVRAPPERPFYRKGWFWAALGAVAVGSATAIFLANRQPGYGPPACSDCTLSVVGVPTQ
jgi:hypothetical protein